MKDVVLARVLDDSTFNVLNSCIIFNQIDIITHVQQDPAFLQDVVRLYVDEDMLSGGGVKKQGNGEKADDRVDLDVMQDRDSTAGGGIPVNDRSSSLASHASSPPDEGVNRRREVVFLIQQLCVMGKNVQLPARMALFRALVDRGILFAVQWALSLSEKDEPSKQLISAGGEIMANLLDHDLHGVRGHVLKQVAAIEKEREAGKKGADKAETLLALICRMLAQSRDLAVQCQVGDALKVMMEMPLTESDGQVRAIFPFIFFVIPAK
jgi:protein phosphatase-4 regulatory subunit 3